MTQTILIVQADLAAAQPLKDYFAQRGDRVRMAGTLPEALTALAANPPDLVTVDLHLPGESWLEFIRAARQLRPAVRVLITNQYPDVRRELLAKEIGCQVFLRQPFTPVWIERALGQLRGELAAPPAASAPPVVRLPVRIKITLPFGLLALIFALAAAYLIGRYVSESAQERYHRQLLDSATLSADWMVKEEDQLLATLRLVANTTGVAEALAAKDTPKLRELALPIAVNNQPGAIELLDTAGVSRLSLRQQANAPSGYAASTGDAAYRAWPFVQAVLTHQADTQGDKFAGLAEAPGGSYFYVAGPIYTPDGAPAGAVLVGLPLDLLARHIRNNTLAHVTFFAASGAVLASTLPLSGTAASLTPAEVAAVTQASASAAYLRELDTASARYNEILAPWAIRNGAPLGWVGTALPQNALTEASFLTQLQSLLFVLGGLALVVAVGVILANHITRPLGPMLAAAQDVARGNFRVKLQDSGNDEVAVLVHAFNQMVAGLQEGSIYRDLLGRAVSPEVREELRDAFASGNLRLEGQSFTATVLMSDIRGFTTLSEKADPALVLKWLNEYFSELVPVITAHGGVVDKFEGDAILAFFGILPRPLAPRESAFQACEAALEMVRVIDSINARRAERGEPLFITGIGLNTGPVTAGGLGAADRLNYTIIGDTVNTTQRLESFTRAFADSAVVVSEATRAALRARQALFQMESLGGHMFKGKSEPIEVYRLSPAVGASVPLTEEALVA